QDLPDDLVSLSRRNAIPLSDLRWNRDVDQLIVVLERFFDKQEVQRKEQEAEKERQREAEAQRQKEDKERRQPEEPAVSAAEEEAQRKEAEEHRRSDADFKREKSIQAAIDAGRRAYAEEKHRTIKSGESVTRAVSESNWCGYRRAAS